MKIDLKWKRIEVEDVDRAGRSIIYGKAVRDP